MWRTLKLVACLTTVGWCAHVLIYFHNRYSHHKNLYSEYTALASSSVCSDSTQRVMSSQVNNCDRAYNVANGYTLSPLTLSALETLESVSLCGDNGLRCYQLITDMKQASLQLTIVVVMVLLALVWLVAQKLKIEALLNTELPLETPNYPSRVPLYVSQKID